MHKETVRFCLELSDKFPKIKQVLRDHERDNDEILPHLFLADVLRWIIKYPDNSVDIINYINGVIENKSTSADVLNLVCVSFIENIDEIDDIIRISGKNDISAIRREWVRMHG